MMAGVTQGLEIQQIQRQHAEKVERICIQVINACYTDLCQSVIHLQHTLHIISSLVINPYLSETSRQIVAWSDSTRYSSGKHIIKHMWRAVLLVQYAYASRIRDNWGVSEQLLSVYFNPIIIIRYMDINHSVILCIR